MIINYLDEKGENVVSPKLHLGDEEEENHHRIISAVGKSKMLGERSKSQ